ncbi:SH3 domain-containing protein [Sphingosinicella sp. YJ22]|uniref:SH3 domain-containing protein n=1 Tax=Sphingosinicella sp. YJ22 TaxID=1104780 RepID=UPI00140AC21E|nr:SH3 domain-containing protein [Sphingosinicella sp. YJ22]
MRSRVAAAFLLLAAWTGIVGVGAPGSAWAQRQPPYWASIAAGRALMRVGPAQTYPATWLYIRPDLPIRVVAIQGDWRRVQDPDGTEGWMLVRLLSDQRSGIVRGESPQPMHESADAGSAVRYRAEPGVVGRVSRCRGGWCLFDVGGRRGYIRVDTLWGVEATETID